MTNGSSYLQPFEAAPSWTSTFDATWGSAATFAVVSGGQTGNALQVTRGGLGSSARVQVFPVKPNTAYQLSVWARCPSFTSAYWAECAYRLGQFTAQDFDANAGSWSMVKKFSDTGANGNGNVWTLYTTNFNTGANTRVSVGFKLGANPSTGPTVHWDQLALVSLALPGVNLAVADTPTNVRVRFAEPVSEAAATNLTNFRLASAIGPLALLGGTLAEGTNLLLAAVPQPHRTDLTLAVSNVTTVLQPTNLTGRNGQIAVRVPLMAVPVDEDTLWKYEESGINLGSAWRAAGYDDSSWASGAALLGDSSGPLAEPIRTPLTVATNKYTFYFRKRFTLPSTVTGALTRLRATVDDGVVFWLNGTELFRLGITDNPVVFTTRAARAVGIAAWEGPFDLAAPSLVAGTNLLAAEVHQADATSPDVVFGATFEALVLPSQLPATNAVLAIALQTNTMVLTWTEPGMTLESATNLLGPWTPHSAMNSPAFMAATNVWRFFRLKQ